MTSSLTDTTLPSLNVQGPRNYPEAAFTRQFLELYKFATKFLWEVWLRSPAPFLVKNVKNCTYGFPYQTRTFFTNLSIFLLGPPLELFCIMNLVFRFRQTCKALSPDCGAPSGWPQVKSWYIIGHDFQIYIDINISLSSSHIIQENSLKRTERISQTS